MCLSFVTLLFNDLFFWKFLIFITARFQLQKRKSQHFRSGLGRLSLPLRKDLTAVFFLGYSAANSLTIVRTAMLGMFSYVTALGNEYKTSYVP